MALLGNGPAPQTVDGRDRHELACRLMQQRMWAEAYTLLMGLDHENDYDIAAKVNLSLCHMAVEEWEAALGLLETALSRFGPLDPDAHPPMNSIQRKLEKTQAALGDYKAPMWPEIPLLTPHYSRDTTLRLLVDVTLKLELWDRVRTFSAQLAGKEYPNVAQALRRANRP